MEESTNQMAITAVLILDGPLDEERLRHLLRDRFLAHERFRQRVEDPRLGLPRWVDDPDFSLDRHLTRVVLEEGSGGLEPGPAQEGLERLVGREMSRPLETDRPLWRMVLVENYRGGSAVIARLHHCIADGLALVRVLLTLDDEEGNEDATYARFAPDRPLRAPGIPAIGAGVRALGSLGRLAGMRPDPRSALRGTLGREKRAAWSAPLGIAALRRAGHEAGATLNDVVLSIIAGGLGRFLLEQGDRLTRPVRALVPVNLRRRAEMETLGNRFGLVFAPLPILVADPLSRVAAVRDAMDRLKRSPQASVVYGLLELFGRTPRKALDLAVWFLGSKGSLVLTNVPGPRTRIRFCGRELVSLVAWVPQSGRLGLGVSVLSYADELRLAVASDALVVPRPQVLVDAFQRTAHQLLESVHVPVGMEVVA